MIPQPVAGSSVFEVRKALDGFKDYQLGVKHPGGWVMAEDTCKFVGTLIRSVRPQRVLEFGSGFSSTVIASELRHVPGARLISLDHNETYQNSARRLAEEHGLGNLIQFCRCPIRPSWYHGKLLFFYDIAPHVRKEMSSLDMVLVDGPPFYWGREAAAYVAYPCLKPGALLLVDDAYRNGERKYIGEWKKLFGEGLETAGSGKFGRGMAVLRKREATGIRRMFDLHDCGRAFVGALRRVANNRWRLRECF